MYADLPLLFCGSELGPGGVPTMAALWPTNLFRLNAFPPVGAAAGCDLLILIFRTLRHCQKSKDRSLVALDSSYRETRT
ncbi:hypothetical protein, partial [Pseudomonas sp. Root68]|uniref:hypothetical protein n=1 Tax=Pseudomonas sp. Root68 TaxID=1736585 RepID=UPI001F1F5CB4